jgi:Flp pilus assembly protein TadG
VRWRKPLTMVGQKLFAPQEGQVVVWVAVMFPLFLSIVGLALDGGIVFNTRRELQNLADGAARAGAMQIDQEAYRESAGATVVLDPERARQVAAAYVTDQGRGLAAAIDADTQRVEVRVDRDVSMSFLRIVGIDQVRITATAPAEVRHGIARGEP